MSDEGYWEVAYWRVVPQLQAILTDPAKSMPVVRQWMMLDLWMALGNGPDPRPFEAEYAKGHADLWASMLSQVRERSK